MRAVKRLEDRPRPADVEVSVRLGVSGGRLGVEVGCCCEGEQSSASKGICARDRSLGCGMDGRDGSAQQREAQHAQHGPDQYTLLVALGFLDSSTDDSARFRSPALSWPQTWCSNR